MRLLVTVDEDGMHIANPARRDPRLIGGILFLLSLVAWADLPELLATLISLVFTKRLAWMIWGRERLIIDAKTLVHSRQIFGLGNWDTYDFEHIHDLWPREPTVGRWARFKEWYKVKGPCAIALRYHDDEESLGLELDEREVRDVIAAIAERLPKSDALAR